MTNEEKAKKLEDIAKLEEQLSTLELPALLRLQKYNIWKLLKFDFVKDQNSKEQCKELDDMANKIIDEGYRLIRGATPAEQGELYKLIKSNYQFLGRRHFKEFMIAIEWDFKQDMKFYDIRKNVFDEWIYYLENLEYGTLEGLSISAPPRTGKTGIGTIFFMWCMLRHPEKSCFFVSHTTAMANKVYNDILTMLQDADGTRNLKAIFPEYEIEGQSAEHLWVQLKTKSSNPYHTAYFRGIDGNMAGILEASWLLYCDDLIKNIEEAMNPTRLETARVKYSVDVTQRKTNKMVKELHIATRWSIHDVISTLETLYSENDKWKFIKRPAINDNGESNFMYKEPFAMDLEHWQKQRNLPDMDEISFNCIYQQEPIERDGLLFSEDNMIYYNGVLPDVEPDLVCSYCDVAWGGGDFLSMPIAKVYGNDVFITDVVYSDKSKTTTKPLVKAAIKSNEIVKAGFEANNGGEEYADDVSEQLKDENYRCAIQKFKAPTNKSKLARIIACVDEITGIGSGYRLIFLDRMARKNNEAYCLFMKHIFMFNQGAKYQGKQKDDCVDSLAGLVTNILESRVGAGTARSRMSRASLGI